MSVDAVFAGITLTGIESHEMHGRNVITFVRDAEQNPLVLDFYVDG